MSGSGYDLEIDGSSDSEVMREGGCGDAARSSRDVRCNRRQQWQRCCGAIANAEEDFTAGSGYGSKRVRQQLRRKAAAAFLLARDAGSKEGRDSGCGERATAARWQGRTSAAAGDSGATAWQRRWQGRQSAAGDSWWRRRRGSAGGSNDDGGGRVAAGRLPRKVGEQRWQRWAAGDRSLLTTLCNERSQLLATKSLLAAVDRQEIAADD
ncbi:hypothetical protein BHE74_00054016 [Ensete ventricosum]|nr:hypothetical protein BHE74_00054016 [Ensete ventricosum]